MIFGYIIIFTIFFSSKVQMMYLSTTVKNMPKPKKRMARESPARIPNYRRPEPMITHIVEKPKHDSAVGSSIGIRKLFYFSFLSVL